MSENDERATPLILGKMRPSRRFPNSLFGALFSRVVGECVWTAVRFQKPQLKKLIVSTVYRKIMNIDF